MDTNAILNIILPIISFIIGSIVGFLTNMCCKRKKKELKHDDTNQINPNDLKDKLDVYWLLYFKLLICLSAKLQIDKFKSNGIDANNITQLENEVVIKNLDDIVNIITQNIQKIDIDDHFLDLILRFISHSLAYKSIVKLNIRKVPSDLGFPYPDEFTQEITRRTLAIQAIYNKTHNIINTNVTQQLNTINPELKRKISTNIEHENNIDAEVDDNNIIDTDDINLDENIIINSDDINLNDIFIDVFQSDNKAKASKNTLESPRLADK